MMPKPGAYQNRAQGQQRLRKSGSLDNPKKYNNQDFEYLRDYHLRAGLLFEDDTFPAGDSSIGPEHISTLLSASGRRPLNIQWKRPGEIQQEPHLLVDGASIFDILQGELGDCWVLSVIGALTVRPHFLDHVLPRNQGFSHNYAGIFHFRLWQLGEWVDVVIDDKLPMVNGKYISVQPRSNNEFWPSLLEKAYAKLRGSYQNLHWGFIAEAQVDFTGGVPMQFNLHSPHPDLRDIVFAATKSGSLIGCTTPGDKIVGNIEVENGLVKGHAYTVTSTAQVPYKNRLEDLIQIWNPWGHGEWNGSWSDNSVEWESVNPEIRNELNVKNDDGQFWMSFRDFIQCFAFINICNKTPTFLDLKDQQMMWTKSVSFGRWVRGRTSGGSFNNESFSMNPQYVIQVPDSDGAREDYNVVVILMQQPSRPHRKREDLLPIGFAFCKTDPEVGKDKLPQTFFDQKAAEVINTGLVKIREVPDKFKLDPGAYVIVPYTDRGLESNFILRVFQKSKDLTTELGNKLTFNTSKRSSASRDYCFGAPQPMVGHSPLGEKEESYSLPSSTSFDGDSRKTTQKALQDSSYGSVFAQYAKPGSEIDASQLQRILNEVSFQDQTFPAVEGGFTLDACRGIIMLMDLKSSGRLDMQDFGCLWQRLHMCKKIFKDNVVSPSKTIDMSGLQNAVQAAGLPVKSEMLRLIIMRYGDLSKRINFPDFVSCIIRLETVTKVFHNLSKDGKGIYLSGDQWMQTIMSS